MSEYYRYYLSIFKRGNLFVNKYIEEKETLRMIDGLSLQPLAPICELCSTQKSQDVHTNYKLQSHTVLYTGKQCEVGEMHTLWPVQILTRSTSEVPSTESSTLRGTF